MASDQSPTSPSPFYKAEEYFPSSPPEAIAELPFPKIQCPQCKGKTYTFTPYFHNTKNFPKPPHTLLPQIETSYQLRNRLKSLLITYIEHSVEPSEINDIEIMFCNWEADVEALARVVAGRSLGCKEVERRLEEVQSWSGMLIKGMWEHVKGEKRLMLGKGDREELAKEFRLLWHGIWVVWMTEIGDCGESRKLEDGGVSSTLAE